jgi:hypothetical protein
MNPISASTPPTRLQMGSFLGVLTCVIAAGCGAQPNQSPEQNETMQYEGDLAVLPRIVVGMTAYSLGTADPAGMGYRQVIDWNVKQGVNLLRIDGEVTTPEQASRLMALIAYAKSKGVAISLGLGVLANQTPTARAQLVSTLAKSLCRENGVLFETDWETAYDSGYSVASFNAAMRQFRGAFGSSCLVPSLAVHTKRNNNYAGTASGYHGTNAGKMNFTSEPEVNFRILHEAGKLEGYGVSEPGPAHPLVMEVLYEDTNGTLAGGNVDATLMQKEGVYSALQSNPHYYYRWYTAASLLSGARGLVYGMAGVSSLGHHRWAWGMPNGGTYEGLPAIVEVAHYLERHGFSPLSATLSDQLVDNGFSGGLKRAKAATQNGTVYIYNPVRAALRISGQSGKVIDLFNPANGAETPAVATITSDSYTFQPPSGFTDSMLLVHAGDNDRSGSGGTAGTSGAACFSPTLARTLDAGTCVQSASDQVWYRCDDSAWTPIADTGSCTATTYAWCYSETLNRAVPPRTCVQSRSDQRWYQCDGTKWATGVDALSGPAGTCSARIAL